MKYALAALATCALALAAARAETPLYLTPDVPTRTSGGAELLPWQIARYDAAGPGYTVVLTVPGQPQLDAIHKLDRPGGWLLSLGAASDLGGRLAAPAEPRDVIRHDAATETYVPFFCGAAAGIPPGAKLDALYLEGGDDGALVASFDVPVRLDGTVYEPADLVRFERTGPGCGDWSPADANPAFDASAAGSGIPSSINLTASDDRSGVATPTPGAAPLLLALNVPARLAPSAGPATYLRGQIASWDGATFDLRETLGGWPPGSIVAALSCEASPGRLDLDAGQLVLGKAAGGQLVLAWPSSCASGADDYGIYEGTLAAVRAGVYDHVAVDCDDAAPALSETIAPGTGDRYYLVVPHHAKDEGSYGRRTGGIERPQPVAEGDRCVVTQRASDCPG